MLVAFGRAAVIEELEVVPGEALPFVRLVGIDVNIDIRRRA